MATENEDEQVLKRCLQLMIDVISANENRLIKSNEEKKALNDIQQAIEKLADEQYTSLSPPCRFYLFDILKVCNYNDQTNTFTTAFTKNSLKELYNTLQGMSKLIDACQSAWKGDESIVMAFIENFPHLINKSGLYGTTLLYSAARNNHFNLVKLLIERGKCAVNARNEDYNDKSKKTPVKATIGSTALHAACFYGNLKIVKYLIQNGADYFITNSAMETPVDNAQSQATRNFFNELLLFSYTRDPKLVAPRSILNEIEQSTQPIVDCIWEYKPIMDDRWFPFAVNASSELQKCLTINCNTKLTTQIEIKGGRDLQKILVVQFLLERRNYQPENSAWIRCRGSSLLNFRCYSQWQILFMNHPTAAKTAAPSLEIFNMPTSKIQINSWYTITDKINLVLERAMNYRRKFITIKLDFMNNELITFDLEKFSFSNQQNTIEGFIRWIPKFVSLDKRLPEENNTKLNANSNLTLLTTSYIDEVKANGTLSSNQLTKYNLTNENSLNDEILDLPNKVLTKPDDITNLVNVTQGNLLEQTADVVVICTSSKYLYQSVLEVGGKSFQKSFNSKHKQNPQAKIISVAAEGQLKSKAVYFLDWHPHPNPKVLCKSIEELVTNVIQQAVSENFQSIAFPAIGCGEFGCSVSTVAEAFVKVVRSTIAINPIQIVFVIKSDKPEIYKEFCKQLDSVVPKAEPSTSKPLFIKIGTAKMEIIKGDITKQKASAIIGSSSSENLRQALIQAGGNEVERVYNEELKNNPNSLIIITPGGHLQCQKIFFLKWEPHKDPEVLRQSVIDLIWNVVQNVMSHNFPVIAFPAIGCGEHGCAVDVIVKTMVREMKKQIQTRKLQWHVKFVVQPNLPNVYDEFCKQLLALDQESFDFQVPPTWERATPGKIRFLIPKDSKEYKDIAKHFDKAISKQYHDIIKIERIQNERWYMQYLAHSREFYKRLNEDTEKMLFHGCPEQAAISIMEDCFNRSFAGVNGTSYGVGVYFSSNASYSHGYTKPNSNGERCMFLARVLVGKTTIGNSSMKTRPLGFDSTTDGNHIFVTYHDAQAYAEYLITYK